MSGFIAEDSPNLTRKRRDEGRVKDSPRGNFQFFFHPDDWQTDGQGRMVPTITQVSKDVGSGAVRADGDFDPELLRLQKAGWVAIPHDVLGAVDYVTPYKNKKGKLVHRSIFQVPYNTADGTTEWAHDADLWADFIKLLRTKGIVKAPAPAVVQALIRKTEQRLEFLLRRQPNREAEPEKVENWQRKLDLCRLTLTNLAVEFEAACKVHGSPAAPGRTRLNLKQLIADAEAANTPGSALAQRLAERAPMVPDLDDDDELDEGEEPDDDEAPRGTPPAEEFRGAERATKEAPPEDLDLDDHDEDAPAPRSRGRRKAAE